MKRDRGEGVSAMCSVDDEGGRGEASAQEKRIELLLLQARTTNR